MTVQQATTHIGAAALVREPRSGFVLHALLAVWAITGREWGKFVRQRGRWASALVRPVLWLVVFAAGFRSLLGVSIVPPYETYVTYQEYIIPGLLGIVLLFYGMQSSLSMVYDREMGMMRLLLTAPMPRWGAVVVQAARGGDPERPASLCVPVDHLRVQLPGAASRRGDPVVGMVVHLLPAAAWRTHAPLRWGSCSRCTSGNLRTSRGR